MKANPQWSDDVHAWEAMVTKSAQLGAATLYEASGLPCALDPGIRAVWPGARVAGPAFTVRCHPGDNLAIHYALHRAPPGVILVVDVGGHLAGYWGEVLTIAAMSRGVRGLVIDGGVRDTEAIGRLGFPAFARGVAVYRTAKHERGEVEVALTVGGVHIAPGDIVVADSDGVIALPRIQCARIVALGQERENNEQIYMQRLRQGETTMDIYRLG